MDFCSLEYPPPQLVCPSSILAELPPGETADDGRAHVRIGRIRTNVNWDQDVHAEPAWAKHRDVQLPKGLTNVTITATHPQSRLMANCSFAVEIIGETD